MSPKPSNRMLSGEIVASLFALGYAVLSISPHSYLHHQLLRHDGWLGVSVWAVALGIPSLLLLIVNFKQWSRTCELPGVVLRSRLILFQGLAWMYATFVMMDIGRGYSTLMVHAFVGVWFCSWSYIENRRVRREIRAMGYLKGEPS